MGRKDCNILKISYAEKLVLEQRLETERIYLLDDWGRTL